MRVSGRPMIFATAVRIRRTRRRAGRLVGGVCARESGAAGGVASAMRAVPECAEKRGAAEKRKASDDRLGRNRASGRVGRGAITVAYPGLVANLGETLQTGQDTNASLSKI